jgi:hypothetical protein
VHGRAVAAVLSHMSAVVLSRVVCCFTRSAVVNIYIYIYIYIAAREDDGAHYFFLKSLWRAGQTHNTRKHREPSIESGPSSTILAHRVSTQGAKG